MKRRRFTDVILLNFSSNLVSLFFLIFLCSVPESESQDFFSPPVVLVDRDWKIPEDEPIGTKVAHARTPDEHKNTEFSIEPNDFADGSQYFRIDQETGAIYLNESMKGKKGQEYYLHVVGYNGHISAKTTVRIYIVSSKDDPTSGSSPSKPTSTNPFSTRRPPHFPPLLTFPPGSQFPPLPPTITPRPDDDFEDNSVSTKPPPSSTKPPVTPKPASSNRNDSGGMIYDPVGSNAKENILDESSYPQLLANDIKNEKQRNATLNGGSVPSNQKEQGSENDQTMIYMIAIPVVIIFGIIPMILASIWCYRRKNKITKRHTKEIRKESAATSNSSVTMSNEGVPPSALEQWIGKRAQSNRYESWNPDDPNAQLQNRWEFPRHHLQIGGILGEGCFGQVWKCEALNIDGKEGTTTVAVKTLKESAGERERLDLISELTVMKMLDTHPNVVRLLGCCTEKDPTFVIMEYVALGKLQSYLRNSRASHYYGNLHADSTSLSSKDLTAFGYQVARGMEYLASKGIIHRDLAARNVLIDKDRICKVADFGFARDVVDNHVYERKTDGRLPIRWMAPEALYDNIFTTKTDVWSFGVLLWEIVTLGSTPYPGMAAGEVMRKVRDGYRLDKPEHCRREFYNIMFYCWAHNPDERPTFSDLVNFLRHLLFSEADYIDLDRFPDHDYYNMSSLSGEKL